MIRLSNDDIRRLSNYHSRIAAITHAINLGLDIRGGKYGDAAFAYDDDSLRHDLALIRELAISADAVIVHEINYDVMRRAAFELFGDD